MDKSKTLKVVIQFAFLRACCKHKSKVYFKNKDKNEKQRSEEKRIKKRTEDRHRELSREERRGAEVFFMTCSRWTTRGGAS